MTNKVTHATGSEPSMTDQETIRADCALAIEAFCAPRGLSAHEPHLQHLMQDVLDRAFRTISAEQQATQPGEPGAPVTAGTSPAAPSETPRCDAAEKLLVSDGPHKGHWIEYLVAEQLERELAVLQEERRSCYGLHASTPPDDAREVLSEALAQMLNPVSYGFANTQRLIKRIEMLIRQTKSTLSAINPAIEKQRDAIDQVAYEIDQSLNAGAKVSDHMRERMISWWKRLDKISREFLAMTNSSSTGGHKDG